MSNYRSNSFFSTIPAVTRNILVINVIVWLACFVFSRTGIDLSNLIGLHYPLTKGFYLFQFITYMFTHVDLTHLFFNMFALFMFGGALEHTWGPKRYLTYYMITGIGAALVQLLVCYFRIHALMNSLPAEMVQVVHHEGYDLLQKGMNYTDPTMGSLNLLLHSVTIGASGAVFGLLLAFGMLFPNTPLYLMFIPIPIKAKYFVIGYGLIELFLGVSNQTGDNVAHFAHLGGMVFGWLLILYWTKNDFPHSRNWLKNKIKHWFSNKKKQNNHLRSGYQRFESEYEYNRKKNELIDEIDRILDKLKKSGYSSLTDEEKKKLFDYRK